jgi:hypothetical protein
MLLKVARPEGSVCRRILYRQPKRESGSRPPSKANKHPHPFLHAPTVHVACPEPRPDATTPHRSPQNLPWPSEATSPPCHATPQYAVQNPITKTPNPNPANQDRPDVSPSARPDHRKYLTESAFQPRLCLPPSAPPAQAGYLTRSSVQLSTVFPPNIAPPPPRLPTRGLRHQPCMTWRRHNCGRWKPVKGGRPQSITKLHRCLSTIWE